MKLLPYKIYSKSGRELARELGIKRIIPGGRYRPKQGTIVINWGNSKAFSHTRMLNKPQAIAMASNKLKALQQLKAAGIPIPAFTSSKEQASEWQEDGFRVVCRTLLSSHSGNGIVIAQPDDALPYAPLYTKYQKKDSEFRVHVFNGKVLDVCEKRKRRGVEVTNSLVRTLNNGWVYCRDGVALNEDIKMLCIRAVKTLGLDFGAVDLISKDNKYFVLEVNSAPGLCGTTLQKYVEALRNYSRLST